MCVPNSPLLCQMPFNPLSPSTSGRTYRFRWRGHPRTPQPLAPFRRPPTSRSSWWQRTSGSVRATWCYCSIIIRGRPSPRLRTCLPTFQSRSASWLATLALAYEKSGALPEALNTLNEINGLIGEEDEMYTDIAVRISRISKLLSAS